MERLVIIFLQHWSPLIEPEYLPYMTDDAKTRTKYVEWYMMVDRHMVSNMKQVILSYGLLSCTHISKKVGWFAYMLIILVPGFEWSL